VEIFLKIYVYIMEKNDDDLFFRNLDIIRNSEKLQGEITAEIASKKIKEGK